MVEVFKTNVNNIENATRLLQIIHLLYPNLKVNFDLEDCDKILRIEGERIEDKQIINLFIGQGFECRILED